MTREPSSPAGRLLLVASGISKRFGSRQVLDDVSFEVGAGEVVGVIGPNGSGKTTLLRICVGLGSPDTGTVALAGEVGYCPQDAGLVELLNAREHFALVGAGRGLDRGPAVEAGIALGRDLDWDPADPTVAQHLSGGTRQKLNVCLAGIGDPQLLVLDEPYQGFDREAYTNLWTAVERWRDEGRGVLVVTHRDATPGLIDRQVELDYP